MKIAIRSEPRNWIFRNIHLDFAKKTRHKITKCEDANIAWLINPFLLRKSFLRTTPSIFKLISLHHIVEANRPIKVVRSFNRNINACVVPNKITEAVAKKYLDIPIYRMPYWVLSSRMSMENNVAVDELRNKLSPNNEILIGSFIHDNNNGFSINKGSDIFFNIVTKLNKLMNIKVVLSGIGREYLSDKLTDHGVANCNFGLYGDINSLYDCLDWYLVTARLEGGPQSVLEASYRKIKILSTNVGLSREVLHSDCICNCEEDFITKIIEGVDKRQENFNTVVDSYVPDKVIPAWDDFLENIVNEK